MKEKIKLSGVLETMLQTVYARAKESRGRGAISQLALSAMDDWGGEIREQNAPVLIVIEGLTMYLNAEAVQQIFGVCADL